mgnify:CR=1 FL=1
MNIKLKTGGIYAFISSDETSSIVLKKMYNGDNSKNFNITCLNGKENVKYGSLLSEDCIVKRNKTERICFVWQKIIFRC